MTDHPPIPTGIKAGVVVARYMLSSAGNGVAAIVEHLLGPGLDIAWDPPHQLKTFRLAVYGRWLRDPDFDPTESAARTWKRLEPNLEPIEVNYVPDTPTTIDAARPAGDGTKDAPPREWVADRVDLLLLLVPNDTSSGEEWIALLRTEHDDQTRYSYLAVQVAGTQVLATRTPEAAAIRDRRVVVVGVGAVGQQVIIDLSRTGVGEVVLIDADTCDVATSARQLASMYQAGHPKVTVLAARLFLDGSPSRLTPFRAHLGNAWPTLNAEDEQEMRAALLEADLVIDATADPAATTYLAALRQARGMPFLHLSATGGAWGGQVFLSTSTRGCWACLQHHRADERLPVPVAAPTTPSPLSDALHRHSPATPPTSARSPTTPPALRSTTSPAAPGSVGTCTSPTSAPPTGSRYRPCGSPHPCRFIPPALTIAMTRGRTVWRLGRWPQQPLSTSKETNGAASARQGHQSGELNRRERRRGLPSMGNAIRARSR